MEESYLAGILVSFLFAFVLFKKDKTITEKTVSKKSASSISYQSSGTTGVARYLQEQEVISGESEYTADNSASGVAKYLANKDVVVSGVSKYMAQQSKQTKENMSGVEKYLKNRS